MEKLAAFTSSIRHGKAKEQSTDKVQETAPVYHGQVLEEDSGSEEKEQLVEWYQGKLKFKKHIDDELRARKLDDIAVIDPRREF